MQLKEIESLLFIQPGAPVPVVLSSEYKLCLLYYYLKDTDVNPSKELPRERNNQEDSGIAVITFNNYLIYKFGYPNAEVLLAHPYYSLGLEFYRMFEVIDSDWVESIKQMNRIHPFHNPLKFSRYKHFILTFEDSTFECIALSAKVEFYQKSTMKERAEIVTKEYLI